MLPSDIKTIRPLIGDELAQVVDYFMFLSPEDDARMGSDRKNFPTRKKWVQILIDDTQKPLQERQFYYLGLFLGDTAIGHTGINKINIGNEAYIHFHL